MIEFKKPFEIFRVNADATFELGKGVDPLVALGELSKAFMKQQDRIKRLEDELMDAKNKHAVLVADVVLDEDRAERIKQLEEAGDELIDYLKHRIKTDPLNPIWHTASIKWGKVKKEAKL